MCCRDLKTKNEIPFVPKTISTNHIDKQNLLTLFIRNPKEPKEGTHEGTQIRNLNKEPEQGIPKRIPN